ncbi:MAG: hypothetical protein LBI53_00140 [Candidatus Peribacteria bacterium]|jgi:hypothetical protein|nr:hypothetical protein [Candidatus Peribacteria bacterium]
MMGIAFVLVLPDKEEGVRRRQEYDEAEGGVSKIFTGLPRPSPEIGGFARNDNMLTNYFFFATDNNA